MKVSYFKILKKRNFFLLWFGQIISQCGDRLTQMALIGLVYKLKPSSSLSLAKIMSLPVVAVFLISPIAGVYIDRWDKRKTMYTSDFLRGIFIAIIPLLAFHFKSIIPIYILIFLSFCMGRFFIPAKMAVIPNLVDKDQTLMANSLVSVTAMIAAVLGFGLGGVIVERFGVEAAFLIDASTFFLSALTIMLMQMEEKAKFNPYDIINLGREAIVKVKRSFAFDIKEGLRYLLGSGHTWYAAKIFFTLFSCLGSLYVVFIVFIQNTFHSVTIDLGWLAVASGLGLFCGSLIYGRVADMGKIRRVINIALIFASSYLVFFVAFLKYHPFKPFALFSCFLLGLISSPLVIGVNTLIHTQSKNNFWGRIFSSLEVLNHFAFIVFMFASSYLAEKFSPFTIIISVGIIIFLFSGFNYLREYD
jgi:MFS family permease